MLHLLTGSIRMIKSGSTGGNWLAALIALAMSYLVSAITPVNTRISFWLRGLFYTVYLTLFLVSLIPAGRYHHKRRHSVPAITLLGGAAGYLIGLFAFLFHPLMLPGGFRLFADALQLRAPEAVFAMIQFPVRLLSWLYGAMMAFLIVCCIRLRRRVDSHTSG